VNMLVMWGVLFVVLAVIAIVSGVIVGLVSRGQSLSDKSIHLASWLGAFLLLGLAELVRNKMHLPYPPQMLRNTGIPFIGALITMCLALICFRTSEWIARRTAQRTH
jgi:hypothetical protein